MSTINETTARVVGNDVGSAVDGRGRGIGDGIDVGSPIVGHTDGPLLDGTVVGNSLVGGFLVRIGVEEGGDVGVEVGVNVGMSLVDAGAPLGTKAGFNDGVVMEVGMKLGHIVG